MASLVTVALLIAMVGVIGLLLRDEHGFVHHVEEGCYGVYWRGGKLLEEITPPGMHQMLPVITRHENIQVSLKTSTVENVPCGTSSGIIIYFSRVEVVHQLNVHYLLDTVRNYSSTYEKTWIHDRIHHEINQLCSANTLHEIYITKFNDFDDMVAHGVRSVLSEWAPGIRIISVRLTKPKIPERLRRNYELIDEQKTQLLIAEQRQNTILKQAETEKRSAILEAEKEFEISKITLRQLKEKKESQYEISVMEDDMIYKRSKEQTNGWFYRINQETMALKKTLTPAYLKYLESIHLTHNLRIYYGANLPRTIFSQRGEFPNELRLLPNIATNASQTQ